MLKTSKIRCMADCRRDKVNPNKCEIEKVIFLFFLFDKDLMIEEEMYEIIKYKYFYFIYL